MIEQIAYHQVYNATQDDQETASALSRLVVLHPYGSLGPLAWQDGVNAVPYGSNPADPSWVRRSARSVKTFTQTVEGDVGQKISSAINEADQICFCGFGFIRQNMELLFRSNPQRPERVFVNMYRMSDPEENLALQAVRDTPYRTQSGDPHIVEARQSAGRFFAN